MYKCKGVTVAVTVVFVVAQQEDSALLLTCKFIFSSPF